MTKIAIREVKTYITDDDKKIEEHKTVSHRDSIPEITEKKYAEIADIVDKDVAYFGYVTVQTPMGVTEERFFIPAKNIDEAYEKFTGEAQVMIKELEEYIKEHESQIITASQQDMQVINELQNSPGIITS
jgi:hypothetical protein